ncbi:MAG: SpaA isopeptide-forming pilin-related protein [Mobilitalea sp.]
MKRHSNHRRRQDRERKNHPALRVFSMLLILTMLCQIILPQVALATPDINLTGQDEYLVVHNTSGAYPVTGGPSAVTVTRSDNSVILPSGNTYSNVPAGAKLKITYVFHLEDGDEEGTTEYEYEDDSYFTFDLPEGITFNNPVGAQSEIHAIDTTDPENPVDWILGTWGIESDGKTVRINLTDAASLNAHKNRWGAVNITGTFDAVEGAEDPESSMQLGTQTINFIRTLPPPPEIGLAKVGSYDPSDNTITWEVTVTPPTGVALTGYKLVDSYSSNQTYVAESFQNGGISVADIGLEFAANKITYTFPDPTDGIQTITYKTSPNTFGAETGDSAAAEESNFTNNASILRGEDTIKGPVNAAVAVDWINKSGANENNEEHIMKWTINVTVPAGGTITGVSVKDTLSSGQEMVKIAPYLAQYKVGTGTAQDMSEDSSGDEGTYSVNGQEITFNLPDLSEDTTIVYYTKITNPQASLNNNGTVTFTNLAALSWDQMPSGILTSPSDKGSVDIVGSGGLLSKGAGSTVNYGVGSDIIHWTITVNQSKITIQDAVIEDDIPEGQILLIDGTHPFTIKKGTTSYFTTTSAANAGGFSSTDGFVNDFTYIFDDEDTLTPEKTIAATYTIDYYTRIIDTTAGNKNDTTGLELLYANKRVDYENDVKLSRTGDSEVSTSGTKSYNSQMLAKSTPVEYNYTDRTTQWRLVINRNRLPLSNAVITDTLPPGLELLIGPSYAFKVENNTTSIPLATAPTSGMTGSTSFTVDLPALTSDQYTITFFTKLTDEALILQGQANKTYENRARLDADEVSNLTATANITVSNPVVTKGYTYETGSDIIKWSAAINAGQVELQDAVISDQLNTDLMLDPLSVKLYEVNVSSTGVVAAASTGTLVDPEDYTVTLPTAQNSNTFKVNLPDGAQAYRLEFDTFIVADNLNVVNQISLTGETGSPTGNANATQITINNLWASGGSGSKSLTVHKVDEKGDPIEGATYRLLNVNKQPIKKSGAFQEATTDVNGNAVFKNLASWVFYVVEVTPPDGYLLNPNYVGGDRLNTDLTFETSDAPALGTLNFTKEAADGTLLSGGEFTLTGTDYLNNAVNQTAASINGVVTFTNLPLGDYTVEETIAPDGYVETSEVITAEVVYNADMTDVDVVITSVSNKLVNQPLPVATITLNKVNNKSEPLEGAEFTIYDNHGAAIGTAISQTNGDVVFSEVPAGTFTIRETKAPNGFLNSGSAITAVVTYNADRTDTIVTVTPGTTIQNNPVVIPPPATPTATIELTKTNGTNSLAGATFELYDEMGSFVQRAVSSSDGLVKFTDVEVGNYTIRETIAPKNYIRSDEVITAVVTYNAMNNSATAKVTPEGPIVNVLDGTLSGTIELLKTNKSGQPLAGAAFELYNASGSAISIATSGTNGKVIFKGVPLGNYTIREISAPANYIKSDAVITAVVSYNEQEGNTLVTLSPNEPVVNVLDPTISGTIELLKVDDKGQPLSGAVFELYDENGNAIREATSDSKGKVSFLEVSLGSYTLKEKSAPKGYEVSDVISNAKITLSTAGTTVKASPYKIVNTLKDINVSKGAVITIHKVDSATKEPLEGAEFTLTSKEGLIKLTAVSDKDGIVKFSDLPPGNYTISETKAPKGYNKNRTPMKLIAENNSLYSYVVENSASDFSSPAGNSSQNGSDFSTPTGNSSQNGSEEGISTGSILPQAGGFMDSAVLITFGVILILTGVVILEVRRRKKRSSWE